MVNKRDERLNEIMYDLEQFEEGCEFNNYIANKCIKWSASERTVKEYVKTLIYAGRLIKKDGRIYAN